MGTHADVSSARSDGRLAQPTFAEQARTLVYLRHIGTLSTLSRKQPGFPYGSVMPYGLDASGNPTFLVSTMAMHTQNLLANRHASLLITQSVPDEQALGASRVTLLGNVGQVTETDLPDVRARYLTWHANGKNWVDYDDFSFYRMDVVDVYYVGGFGVMGWISPADYNAAQPDPLVDSASEIIRHMNEDHADALSLLTKKIVGVESTRVQMISVDRLGFSVHIEMPDGTRTERIPFSREAKSPAETRKVLIEMVTAARAR